MLCEVPQVFRVVSSWPTHFFMKLKESEKSKHCEGFAVFPACAFRPQRSRHGGAAPCPPFTLNPAVPLHKGSGKITAAG